MTQPFILDEDFDDWAEGIRHVKQGALYFQEVETTIHEAVERFTRSDHLWAMPAIDNHDQDPEEDRRISVRRGGIVYQPWGPPRVESRDEEGSICFEWPFVERSPTYFRLTTQIRIVGGPWVDVRTDEWIRVARVCGSNINSIPFAGDTFSGWDEDGNLLEGQVIRAEVANA